MREHIGPDGERVGVTGTQELDLAFAGNAGRWVLRRCKLVYSEGFLTGIEGVNSAPGVIGATVTAYLPQNLREDNGRLLGDIVRLGWVDGLLVDQVRLLSSVELEPVAKDQAGSAGSSK